MSKHGEGYIEGVPSVTELLEAAGYYDAYRSVEDREYYLARGHWVGDRCDEIAQNIFDPDKAAQILWTIQNEHPNWWTRSWETTLYAYESWLSRYPRRKLIDVQGYVHHKTLSYQGRYDQRWILEPGDIQTIVDLKCVSDGAHCQKCTALQLAGYREALIYERPGPNYKRLGLALHSDGTFFEDWYTNWRDYPNWRNLVAYHSIHGPKGEYR